MAVDLGDVVLAGCALARRSRFALGDVRLLVGGVRLRLFVLRLFVLRLFVLRLFMLRLFMLRLFGGCCLRAELGRRGFARRVGALPERLALYGVVFARPRPGFGLLHGGLLERSRVLGLAGCIGSRRHRLGGGRHGGDLAFSLVVVTLGRVLALGLYRGALYLVAVAASTALTLSAAAGAVVGLKLGGARGALLLGDQRLPVGDRDL